jgi:hypoxanthine phosphoribosyltransferase
VGETGPAAAPACAGERLVALYAEEEILRRVGELAAAIRADVGEGEAVLVGILKGAFVFLADLVRALGVPVAVDFVRVASYGERMESAGRVAITKDVELDLAGRDVVVVEDILDSGLTARVVLDHLAHRRPRTLRLCTLVDKRERRRVDVKADYVGFVLERGFIVGYGIDYAERYRQLPAIYTLEGAS